jgi:branched-chain amino acid transport system ATP-binding protein
MLEIEGLNAWYGLSHVIHGLSLTVEQGEILTLIGRNGAGKTSTLRQSWD